ncbi:MAG: ATP-binding protein [Patescibacteria group bacterium]|nr:ATP-binding protein [Patescibacteria group bacterium]
MPNYNFEMLNDKDFEDLSRDLLQLKLKLELESFKSGRDNGIDLRYATIKHKNEIIVQAKHYLGSGYKKLLSKLVKEELPKVKKLKPKRYIITTSLKLTPKNKEKIVEELKPYVRNTGDIIDGNNLNNLLNKYPEIEESHFKLWLSSTNILQKVINNGISGRSEFTKENIKKKIQLYVKNNRFSEATEILNKEKFLIIIGSPGIGKSTMAHMLIYNFLKHSYQVVDIKEKISEAEDLWKPRKKQIFYFDDFLGSNYIQIINSKNSDKSLINFIKRIKGDPTKRMILTSRTTIINQATQEFPNLDNPEINLSKHEVNISDYGDWEKAMILYNHMFFSGINKKYLSKIVENKNYWKIIKHTNFNPRLIEFITDKERVKNLEKEGKDYMEFILYNLNNPSEIWKHPYETQLDDYAKFMVSTLFSLSNNIGSTNNEQYDKAFEARLNYEINTGGFKRKHNIFNLKIKELLGSFIKSYRAKEDTIYYNFFNHSIEDFLINYLQTDNTEKKRILESAIYVEQFNKILSFPVTFLTEENLKTYQEIFRNKENILETAENTSKELLILNVYCKIFGLENSEEDILRNLKKLDISKIGYKTDVWINILKDLVKSKLAKEYVLQNWDQIISQLFESSGAEEDFEEIINLFTIYSQEYISYINNKENEYTVKNALEWYWEDKINEVERSGYMTSSITEEKMEEEISTIYSEALAFNEQFGIKNLSATEKLFDIDTEELAKKNYEVQKAEDYADNFLKDENNDIDDIQQKIDELFN